VKRDPRLKGLSSDHHHGLVLARRIATGSVALDEVRRRFEAELEPHFRTEEERLLPALLAAGERALVERTISDHASLRGHLTAAGAGQGERLAAFGAALEAHIRFEERELFPAIEASVPSEVLDALGTPGSP